MVQPAYDKAALRAQLTTERATVAAIERQLGELEARSTVASDDRLRAAHADLAVRRQFVAALEACEAIGRWCPPRLDDPPWTFDPPSGPQPGADPPMTAALQFDLAGWRALASELHGRACACRTLTCVDSLDGALAALEPRPAAAVRGDEAATASVTWARECLFRLRGKLAFRSVHAIAE